MAFHFPLDTLLRYRRSLEHQEKLRFQEALRQVAAVQSQIGTADQQLRALAETQSGQLSAGLTSAELHFHALCRNVLQRRREELQRELAEKQRLCELGRRHFLEAQRQREIVETLRRRQFQLYRQKETRVEQARLDEMFLLRRELLRRG